jgi:tRNA threonylcarbamoyl adenosine modification protein YeaZ
MIVAMDTSSALTSVAVVDGDRVIAERAELEGRRHAEVLAPMLRDVLDEAAIGGADVESIVCGVGPGPYTGLRVGIASARALGLAWGRPVVGICSLDAIAAAVFASGRADAVGVASDARRHEVYWAWYDEQGARTAGPQVARADDIDPDLRSRGWAGHGAAIHRESFAVLLDATEEFLYPQAGWIGRRADELISQGVRVSRAGIELSSHGDDGRGTSSALAGLRLLPPEPLYLRRPDAAEPGSVTSPLAGGTP